MTKTCSTTILLALIGGLIFVYSFSLTSENTFKILRLKGKVTLNSKMVKVGDEYPVEDIDDLKVLTKDESGFVVLCYNNCSKNKVVLEKTINLLDTAEKRKLIETTSFKSRGDKLASFSELINFFEKKPILIIGNSRLNIKESVLGFPKAGSFLDLYYLSNNNEIIYKIPYENESFLFKRSMFGKTNFNEDIVGPITISIVDPEGAKETPVTEEFYVALVDTSEIENYVTEMSTLDIDKQAITEGIYDWLKIKYPQYYIDDDFVKQYVENQ